MTRLYAVMVHRYEVRFVGDSARHKLASEVSSECEWTDLSDQQRIVLSIGKTCTPGVAILVRSAGIHTFVAV